MNLATSTPNALRGAYLRVVGLPYSETLALLLWNRCRPSQSLCAGAAPPSRQCKSDAVQLTISTDGSVLRSSDYRSVASMAGRFRSGYTIPTRRNGLEVVPACVALVVQARCKVFNTNGGQGDWDRTPLGFGPCLSHDIPFSPAVSGWQQGALLSFLLVPLR